MVLYLREAIRAIASLGCEGAMRAIASSMSPASPPSRAPNHYSVPQPQAAEQPFKPSAPPRRHCQRPQLVKGKSPQVKGYCTDRAIFALLSCTTDVFFFSYCVSVAAHFKHAATRQPRRKPAVETCVDTVETCVDNTAKLRPQASFLALRAAGANQLLRPASTTPRSYGRRHRPWHAHFKHAATRQPRRKPTVKICVDNTAKLRPQAWSWHYEPQAQTNC